MLFREHFEYYSRVIREQLALIRDKTRKISPAPTIVKFCPSYQKQLRFCLPCCARHNMIGPPSFYPPNPIEYHNFFNNKHLTLCVLCLPCVAASAKKGELCGFENYWRRRELNPHLRNAIAACSRCTTSPTSIFAIISNLNSFFHNMLELPLVIADNFFYRLTADFPLLVGRVSNRHKLNHRNILRYTQYRFDLFCIERPYPAGPQP